MLHNVLMVKVISKIKVLRSRNLTRISYLHFNQLQTNWLGQRAAECIPCVPERTSKRFRVKRILVKVMVYFLFPAQVKHMLSFSLHLSLVSLKSQFIYLNLAPSLSLPNVIHCLFPLSPFYFIIFQLLTSCFSVPTMVNGPVLIPRMSPTNSPQKKKKKKEKLFITITIQKRLKIKVLSPKQKKIVMESLFNNDGQNTISIILNHYFPILTLSHGQMAVKSNRKNWQTGQVTQLVRASS